MSNVIDFQKAKDKRDIAKNNIVAGKSTVKVDKLLFNQLLGDININKINDKIFSCGFYNNGDDKNAS